MAEDLVYPIFRNVEIKGAYFRKKEDPDLEAFIAEIKEGTEVTIIPTTENEYDPYCAEVYVGDRWIGYVPKECSAIVHFFALVDVPLVGQVTGHAKKGPKNALVTAVAMNWEGE